MATALGKVCFAFMLPVCWGTVMVEQCNADCESLRSGFGSTIEGRISSIRSDVHVAPESLKLGNSDEDKT